MLSEKASFLWTSGVIKFGNFELKSGRSSPVFISIAEATNSGCGLFEIGWLYAFHILNYIKKHDISSENLLLFVPAYKGIPLVSVIAVILYSYSDNIENVRIVYDRKEEKKYGELTNFKNAGFLVGKIEDGDSVIVVDDVLTDGRTKLLGIEKIQSYARERKISVNIEAIIPLVDRLEGGEVLRDKYDVIPILTLPALISCLYDLELITKDEFDHYFEYFQRNGIKK